MRRVILGGLARAMRAGLLAAVIVACGPGGERIIIIDSPPPSDALADAGCLPRTSVCNPLGQTGCEVGDKCTWLTSGEMFGYIGCAARGPRAIGEACAPVEMVFTCGRVITDDCEKGGVCAAGTCRAICDLMLPDCPTATTCLAFEEVFVVGGNRVAGVCTPD